MEQERREGPSHVPPRAEASAGSTGVASGDCVVWFPGCVPRGKRGLLGMLSAVASPFSRVCLADCCITARCVASARLQAVPPPTPHPGNPSWEPPWFRSSGSLFWVWAWN